MQNNRFSGLAGAASAQMATEILSPNNAAQAVLSRLGELTKQVAMVLDRLERVPTRAFGGGNTKAEGMPPKAIPNGEFGAIEERLDDLQAVINGLTSVADQIDKIV